jgi:hypothetical protein
MSNVAEGSAITAFEGAFNLVALALHRRRSLRRQGDRSVSRHILGSPRLSLLTAYPQEITAQPGLR